MRGRQRSSTPALATFYALRWRLLTRIARRDRAATIQRTGPREVADTVGSSWPVNRRRSPVADDVRERVS
jgi:hypothetical protein